MIFLYNFNINDIFYSVYGVSHFFLTTCTILSDKLCVWQAFISIFICYLPGFAIAGLMFYKLMVMYVANLKDITDFKQRLIISTLSFWVIPIILTSIQLFANYW